MHEADRYIKEDEIYLSVHKDNPASLKVQLKNGASIVGETEEEKTINYYILFYIFYCFNGVV